MNFCWLTDIHLNVLSKDERIAFYQQVIKTKSDAILITGDIADATSLNPVLTEMANTLKKPIYFVLGNHDYYHSEIKKVEVEIKKLCGKNSLLHWLSIEHQISFNNNTLLLGQDGWADGRCGDYQNSRIILNDRRLIYDLFTQSLLGKNQLLAKMQELAEVNANALEADLTKSITLNAKKIIILTHVPPFEGACWHQGETNHPDWMPFFTSKIMGDVILAAAQKNPSIEFMVLCGHTHSRGIYQPLPNLLVKTGKAEYCSPEIQEIITI
ncbi:MAG: metallophosphoesterase [Gammaproteobacteria bacterium]|nr:metallophosphoesterase [Gammaproteobacteria bacterium]